MMRFATYNVEWFDALFDDAGQVLADGEWSSRRDVTRKEQLEALGKVFAALDCDGVMIVEAPDSNRKRDTVRALENFARHFSLRCNAAARGFPNDTQQELAFLYDPQKLKVQHTPKDHNTKGAPAFDSSLHLDLDVDNRVDKVRFSKPPLELSLQSVASGQEIQVIGVHLKSKAPHGARNRDDVMRISIANRRKQLAQAIWLRRRVDALLVQGHEVMVMGDLNDGPGLDSYEELFGRSSVEIVQGQGESALYDPHAARALERRIGAHPTTARFYIDSEERYLQALLDYILISPGLRTLSPQWRIWHPFDDARCWRNATMRTALLTASDHFPVTLGLNWGA